MRIAEIFESLQGEGRLTGTPSVFIRASGCNLRCIFCDTRYASWEPTGDEYSIDAILQRVHEYKSHHVVITGGEPMIFDDLVPLCDGLHQMGRHITIETAGTVDQPVRCDLMSISPKTSNSTPDAAEFPTWHQRHEQRRIAPEVIRRLISDYAYQIKFVVAAEDDVLEVHEFIERHPEVDRSRVMLMPQATTTEEQNVLAAKINEWCQRDGFSYCPRRHIEWFGCRPGT